MECGKVLEKLSLYLDGVLDEATLEAIEEHLGHCSECRAELEALQSLVGFAGEIGEVEPPVGLAESIRNAVAREREQVPCAAWLPMLSEYIDGELDTAQADSLELHLTSCEFCSDELVALRATVGAVSLVEELAPPTSLRARIAAATTGKKKVPAWTRLMDRLAPAFELPRLRYAAGAAAAAAVFTALALNKPSPEPQKPQVSIRPVHVKPAAPAPVPVAATTPAPEIPVEYASPDVARHIVREKIAGVPAATKRPVAIPIPVAKATPDVDIASAEPPVVEPPTTTPTDTTPSTPSTGTVAENPVDKTVAAPAPTLASLVNASNRPKVSSEELASYFKDVKAAAAMMRRNRGSIEVRVVSKEF